MRKGDIFEEIKNEGEERDEKNLECISIDTYEVSEWASIYNLQFIWRAKTLRFQQC
jgi:hypothetical protein